MSDQLPLHFVADAIHTETAHLDDVRAAMIPQSLALWAQAQDLPRKTPRKICRARRSPFTLPFK